MTELAFIAGIVMGGILYRLIIDGARRKAYDVKMAVVDAKAAENDAKSEKLAKTTRLSDIQLAQCTRLNQDLIRKVDEFTEVTRAAKFLTSYWPDEAIYVIYNAKNRVCRGFDRENSEFGISIEDMPASGATGGPSTSGFDGRGGNGYPAPTGRGATPPEGKGQD